MPLTERGVIIADGSCSDLQILRKMRKGKSASILCIRRTRNRSLSVLCLHRGNILMSKINGENVNKCDKMYNALEWCEHRTNFSLLQWTESCCSVFLTYCPKLITLLLDRSVSFTPPISIHLLVT